MRPYTQPRGKGNRIFCGVTTKGMQVRNKRVHFSNGRRVGIGRLQKCFQLTDGVGYRLFAGRTVLADIVFPARGFGKAVEREIGLGVTGKIGRGKYGGLTGKRLHPAGIGRSLPCYLWLIPYFEDGVA